MNTIFGDMEGVECVIGDILIWGHTIEEHEDRLMAVLDRAKLDYNKCKIGLQ